MASPGLAEDMALVRALAEEGRAAPLLSGGHMLGWGLLVSAAWAGHYGIISQIASHASWGPWMGALWGGFGIAGLILSALLRRRLKGRPGHGSVGNRGDRAIWIGMQLALLACVLGALLRMALFHDNAAPNTILPVALALYGAAMVSTGRLSGQAMLQGFGLLAIGLGCVAGVIASLPQMYLLGSAAALLVLALPGALLLRREPAAAK